MKRTKRESQGTKTTIIVARLRGASVEEAGAAAKCGKPYASKVIADHIRQVQDSGQDNGDPVKQWQVARARKTEIEVEHRTLLLDRARGALIEQTEVREVFSRVFAAYRQATREIDRRYGPEAAAILIQAERSALRVQSEEPCLEQN